MKKILMIPVIAILPLASFAQNWNPWVNSANVSPAPLLPVELNGTGTLSFNIGNSGSDDLTAGGTANNQTKLVISLSNGVPDNVNPLSAVSGTMASRFSWVYNAPLNTFTATQIQTISGLDAGTIIIAYKVTQNSTSGALSNGFNVNLTAPAYASVSNSQPDDNTNAFTYTTLSVGGSVLNDANGQRDSLINGAGMNPGGLIAVLVNSSGITLATSAVSATGAYNFPDMEAGNYSVLITTTAPTIGAAAPAITLPSNWVNTAEGNTGLGDGNANGTTIVTLGATTITNINFGIERLPNSSLVSTGATAPVLNSFFILNGSTGNLPAPSGTDDEDGILQAGKKLIITALPSNSVLIYNDIPVILNQVITSFDPDLLKLQVTAATIIASTTNFQFAYFDAADKQDPTPANYLINWGSPLAIHLSTFTAVAENNRTRLDWTTLSETGNTGFDIERSADSKHWIKIGFISSLAENGNSNQKLQYVAYDEEPIPGVDVYRLKQTDQDGTVSYSDVRLVNFEDATGTIAVYPNPTTDVVNIRTNDWNNISNVSISDANGRMLLQVNDATKEIHLNGFAKGTYLIQVVKKDGTAANFKIIKN
ncbi:T9SS type A sorting domain-containing protein [Taibaiella lutea]|uniref:T9SS type A sorting domain-containing protein n=1 Tax=Taibaiella lutea TaxID=2608001 RepID=A0A5M6CBR6_9BACT|nr:T9SS type A sorting domain-containing protein [Taibaiella lutea]KAA5532566.1 T9SS type A sorting domain-containing protein [Taibaiella lutea]